jgi:rRNA pseudouridine-1189 N-methylase Emg1 (Nep1/Mra1 family)
MNNSNPSPFIFFLTISESLSQHYYIFDSHFKELGFVLVPVKMDQLQSLLASSEQEQIIIVASVSDGREYKSFNEKIRNRLKFILKSKRINFVLLSSFSRLNDKKNFSMQKNYFFMKFPLDAKQVCSKIAQFHEMRLGQKTIWPGGRRASVGGML